MNLSRLLARAAVPVAALGLVATAAPAYAAPVTGFQMPFPCAQSWTGTTRSNHSPSVRSVDWNRTDDLGDPVVAAAAGEVKVADTVDNSGYGRWVWITHADGESSIYAHLNALVVKQGQAVDQGTVIGYVGSSGKSTGPHLHFEERSGSTVVEPYFDRTRFVFGSTLASRNCVDVPMAGNMIGDARAELVVYRREARGSFQIHRPGSTPLVRYLGTSTDEPVLGDWDGDGRLNPGVRTPGTRTFTLQTPAGRQRLVFGVVGDLPVAGDWDGDGRWEIGVRRPSSSQFVLRNADGSLRTISLGDGDDVPVTGDWNGDRVTDLGVFDPATAQFTLRIEDADGLAWTAALTFGRPGDLPVSGDWDANGRTDVGVWSPSTATFSQRRAPSATAAQRNVTNVRFGRVRR